MVPIICDWDATSIKPGPSANRDAWVRLLHPHGDVARTALHVHRRSGAHVPAVVEGLAASVARSGAVPLLLGGDHGLSYALHRGVRAGLRGEPLSLLHLDAHHDAWATPAVSNYSVMRAVRELGTDVVSRGVREEAPDDLVIDTVGPLRRTSVHVSVDVDVLDPQYFGSVSFPLAPTGEDSRYDVPRVLAEVAAALAGRRLVALDVVEWRADLADAAETATVAALLAGLLDVPRHDPVPH